MNTNLKPRLTPTKPAHTTVDERSMPDVVVLKFVEGSGIRLRGGRFVAEARAAMPDETLLARSRLDMNSAAQQLESINRLLTSSNVEIIRAWSRTEEELAKDRLVAQSRTGEEMADLDLYSYLRVTSGDRKDSEKLIDALNAHAIVEIAYPQYVAQPASSALMVRPDVSPTTGNFEALQSYKRPAPVGIDSEYAALFPGGRGRGIRIIDVESGWTRDHEDFPPLFFDGAGINSEQRAHGTAVVGVLAAPDNGFGVTGIATDADVGVCTVWRLAIMPIPAAIDEAASHLRAGDVLLIEMHAPGPASGRTCMLGDCSQWEFVAQEYWQQDWDVIHNAVGRDIVVVEAAGNGGMDLDDAFYEERFDRGRDSGAILVGAGFSNGDCSAHPWSNAGTRVDVQGWGDSVMTLQYGNVRANGDDERQFYTTGFSGTSSASPVVAGAAACVQGILSAAGRPILNSKQMRDLLSGTGTGQRGSRNIGPLPNLRRALSSLGFAQPENVEYYSGKFVAYIDAGGRVWGMAVDNTLPWRLDDLTSLTGAPPAATTSRIAAYRWRAGQSVQVAYCSADGHIHELFVMPGNNWAHADLTVLTGAPPADGRHLSGYAWERGAAKQIVYTTSDGHIHELVVSRGGAWSHADLTEITGAPPADGRQVCAGTFEAQAEKHVVYTDSFGLVHELVARIDRPWTYVGTARITTAPFADGRTMAGYGWVGGQSWQCCYATPDGHIIAIFRPWNGAWQYSDLTAQTGAPLADHRGLWAHAWEASGSKQIVYTTAAGHIVELSVGLGSPWMWSDLTAATGAPLFTGGPLRSAAWEGSGKHVVYVVGGRVIEMYVATGASWAYADLTSLSAGVPGTILSLVAGT
jgi:hypothetical protein